MSVTGIRLDQAAVEALSRRAGEPSWLTDRRVRAFDTYNFLPLPSDEEEPWRHTPLSGLDLDAVVPYRHEAPVARSEDLPRRLCPALSAIEDGSRPGAALLQYNSSVVYRTVPDHLEAQGVIFTDLHTAARERPEIMQRRFMTDGVPAGASKFTALHAALWSGGAFLYVPPGVYVAEPLQFALWADHPGLGVFHHTLICADEGSRVALLERLESADGRPGLVSGVVEIFAAEGARVTYAGLQGWGDQVRSFTMRRARLEAGATVDWVTGEFGGALARVDQETRLEGEGAQGHAVTLFFPGGRQHMDIGAWAIHVAPRTGSEILARGAVAGDGRAVFRGMGHIWRGAHGSRVSQREQSLLLGGKARADVIPALLIDDDDVQAGHAATAGQVDREQLFYLMSRGIPEAEACRMIVHGFFQPLFERIPPGAVRREFEALIDAKMIEDGKLS